MLFRILVLSEGLLASALAMLTSKPFLGSAGPLLESSVTHSTYAELAQHVATCNDRVAGHGSSRFHSQDILPIASAPPRLRASSTRVTSTLLSVPVASHNHTKFTKIPTATAGLPQTQLLNKPSVQRPRHIRISVGNSFSRRLLANKPNNGTISISAPAKPSVMTWARPFSVAATSSSKGFLKGLEHEIYRDDTDRSRKKR